MSVEALSATRSAPARWLGLVPKWLAVSLATVLFLMLTAELIPVWQSTSPTPAAIVIALAVGLVASVSWTLRETRVDSARMYYYLQVIVRFGLSYIFIGYGLSKLLGIQFGPPTFFQLDKPVGTLPGIQLTWLFFGYSFAYGAFIALSQIACSILLAFRRTYLLGACLLLPVIGNIVFVNFTHGIPVKLNSTIYLIATLSLLVPELPRFKALFWDHAPVPGKSFPALSPRYRGAVPLATAAFLAGAFAYQGWVLNDLAAPTRPGPVAQPVAGAWRVERCEPMAPTATPLVACVDGPDRWQKVLFENRYGGKDGFIKFAEGYVITAYKVDPARRSLTFESTKGRSEPFTGTYRIDRQADGDRLVLEGKLGPDPVRIHLVKERYRFPSITG
ncbi:MAG TPA: hypothetical protein VEL74_19540 [Thermoanaerobaculia bacterium]|nr:hypothetical protein [Thermoanaerobaculia bacterium]